MEQTTKSRHSGTSFPNVLLSEIQMHEGHYGVELDAVLFIDGIKTAAIHDDARGGTFRWYIFNGLKMAEFEKALSNCKPVYMPSYQQTLSLDKDLFIDLLNMTQEEGKQLQLEMI